MACILHFWGQSEQVVLLHPPDLPNTMKLKLTTSVAITMLAGLQISQAVTINLTTSGTSGTANGGLFVQIDNGSTGTGVIEPFVRLQANGTEQGYNTDLKPMPDVKTGTWTKDILLSAVPVVSVGSIPYYQFLLDINEKNDENGRLLSLYQLQIFTKLGALTSANEYSDLTSGATKVWDLDVGSDGNSLIELNYSLNPGSGYGDMFAYIPVSAVGTDLTKNLYLFSAFGTPQTSDAGFEEWAVLRNSTPPPSRVPDGGTTVTALGFALLGLGSIRKLIGSKG